MRSGRGDSTAAAAALSLLAGLLVVTVMSSSTVGRAPDETSGHGDSYLVISGERLSRLPTEGQGWRTVQEAADDADAADVNLADQDNKNAARVLAAALVHARTGSPEARRTVVRHLERLVREDLDDARSLSVGRQLAGYVIAADLVGYRDEDFDEFLRGIRTRELGGHPSWTSLETTSERTASNWGAWALASRIAISQYLGDGPDVRESVELFKRFTGEPSEADRFVETEDFDPTWACGGTRWAGINAADCGERSGAVVEDISRSDGSYPSVDDAGRTYSWETLGAATLSATLLECAGHPDVWGWGDSALLRAAEFLQANGGYPPLYSSNQYIPWVIDAAYGEDMRTGEAAGYGRQFGYTDWLYHSSTPTSASGPGERPGLGCGPGRVE